MIIVLQEFQTSHRESFENNFRQMQEEYTDFLSTLYVRPKDFKEKLLLACDPIVTNNPYQSEFYEDLCQLITLFEYIEAREDITGVEVNTFQQQQILSEVIKARDPGRTIQVFCHESKLTFWLSELYKEIKGIGLFFYTWLLFRIYASSKRREAINLNRNYILFDTYLLKAQLNNGKFHNRYFPNEILSEIRREHEQGEILFFPELTHDFFSKVNFRALEVSGSMFLFKHDFLLNKDFVKVLKLTMGKRLPVFNSIFKGVDLAKPIKAASSRLKLNYLMTTLNYYVVERLKSKGVKIIRFIDWWENQMIDKVTNLAMANLYPDTPVYGFMNYLVDLNYNFNILPTKFQRDLSFAPINFLTSSKYIEDKLCDFGESFNTEIIKSNRFNLISENAVEKNNILLILPILPSESYFILRTFQQFLKSTKIQIGITIKLHPADCNKSDYEQLFSGYKADFTDDSLDRLYRYSNLVISSTSSACVEALINKIPVIILSDARYIQNPVPFISNNKMYRKVDNIQDLKLAVDNFMDPSFLFDGRIALELKKMFIS